MPGQVSASAAFDSPGEDGADRQARLPVLQSTRRHFLRWLHLGPFLQQDTHGHARALLRVPVSACLMSPHVPCREAEMLADWCCGPEARAIAAIRALWLFEGRLGDEGAVQVARILAAHPGMAEVWWPLGLCGWHSRACGLSEPLSPAL